MSLLSERGPFFRRFLAIYFLTAALVGAGGWWFYDSQREALKADVEGDLEDIVNVKAGQLSGWLAERLADAAAVMDDESLPELLEGAAGDPQSPGAKRILSRLRYIERSGQYKQIAILDKDGAELIRLGQQPLQLHPEDLEQLSAAMRERKPVFVDLHKAQGDDSVFFSVIAPILPAGNSKGPVLGAVILVGDARANLLPLVSFWPVRSASAETLIARREGASVLFLSDLRHRSDSAMKYSIPVTRNDVPAVAAVLGREGVWEGTDYRGEPVVAVLKHIPGSSWYMVSKIDRAEAFAAWHFRSAMILLVILLIMGSALAAGLVLWKRSQAHFYRAVYRAEVERRKSEERYRVVLMSVGDGVICTDADGNVELLNKVAEGLTGWKLEDARGKRLEDVFPIINEASRVEVENPVRRAMREGIIVGLANHTLLIGRDGVERPIADSAAPIRAEDGTISGVVLVFRDITGTKEAELEKERLHARFLQAQKMEAVGRLAGGVAHDFNNILGVIIGHSEMAMADLDPSSTMHQSLSEIYKAAQRSAKLTKQLLAFARKQTVSPRPMELNETIAGMLSLLRRMVGEDIDLQLTKGMGLWHVKMDPSQLDQILANMVVNARDAIASVGKITIETRNVVLDREYCNNHAGFLPGEYVLMAVSDNGAGMDKDIMEHIFEPFFTTKETGKGTGLGLATVYGIVKQNNGFINAYSEPGRGTTFTIYFPRHRMDVSDAESVPVEEQTMGGNETILVVEDEDSILKLVERMLGNLGYEVLSAPNQHEALAHVASFKGQIHLVLSDVVMPQINGKDLFAKLSEIRPGLKCLFMSGYTADAIVHHGVLEEGINFLQKPFSSVELAKKIREALDS